MDTQKIKDNLGIYWRPVVLIVLCISTALIFYFAFRSENRVLTVAFLDVGQGDAIFIESPNGNQIIFDGGPGSALVRAVAGQVSLFDRHIDMIVVTNPDKDHFEGFIPLLSRYTVGALVDTGVDSSGNPLYRELEKEIEKRNIPVVPARTGQKILLGGGAYIDIIFPDQDVSQLSHNDASLVARLVYGDTSVLLAGDTTKKMENYMVSRYGDFLKADILKVAHHGSKTSTEDAFVKAVNPDIAVISAGKENSYGHPHQEVLDVLKNNSVDVLVTAQEGTIVFESDGKNWKRK